MTVWAIVVAAGSGTRFGRPKQFERLGDGRTGNRIIDLSCAVTASAVDGVVVVVSAEHDDLVEELEADVVVTGGATRSDSVRAGLAAVPGDTDVVVVHDAARPFASRALFESVVTAVSSGYDAAVPGIAISDTIKRIEDSVVTETLDRSALVAVQTPQAFDVDMLRRAHESSLHATDDAGLVEQLGGRVVVVPGEIANIKITTPHDMVGANAHWGLR